MSKSVREKQRERKRITIMIRKRLLLILALIMIGIVGLLIQLMRITNNNGKKYEKIVLSQQEYDSRIIPYQRGNIVDTKGTVLATSVDVYNVILDCKVLNENEEDIEDTFSALEDCFEELQKEDLKEILKENPESQYVVLQKRVSYDLVLKFMEIQNDREKNPHVNKDAIWFEKEYIRDYPYHTLAASLIGFVSSGNVGTTGLENYYNSVLNGVNGRQYGYLNSDNNFEKTTKDAKDGNTIVSTIDVNIQTIVEHKIKRFNEEHANGFTEGNGSSHTAVMVMNPNNGEILAMANYPTFDLNEPRELTNYFSEESLAGKTEEEKMDLLNQLWENFCVSHTYEPGSTQKPFTVATGLETGTLSGNEVYVCDGVEHVGGSDIHCVNRYGHGNETIEKALMDSCNDALMQMSYAIKTENFTRYQEIYGFGRKTNIDLPGEPRTDSLVFTNENMKPIDLATNSFGQNYNCTMVQLASAFCSLINGGNYYQPHVVKKILDAEGNTIQNIEPTILKQTISKDTSDTVRGYLTAVVAEGTGNTAKVNGYSMGGKTGTAQKIPRAEKKYLVSFIGFAPADNPQVLIYVVVDEPNVEDQAHSTYSQEIAKSIMTEILPYMNIFPDEEITEEEGEEEEAQGTQPSSTGEGEEGNSPVEDGETPAEESPGSPDVEPEPDIPEDSPPDAEEYTQGE